MLLVHGGWHGAWCWEPIRPGLRQAGVSPRTVELPMESLSGDAETLSAAIGEIEGTGPLVVVGHSYAGQVVSVAAHAADRLVYVAAIAAEANEPILDSVGFGFGVVPGVEIDEKTWATRLTAKSLPSFYGNAGQPAQDWALPRLRPLAAGCIAEALPCPPAWREVPTEYLISTDDEMLPVDYQRACGTKIGRSTELVADHSPFASAPNELTTALVGAAESAHQGWGAEVGFIGLGSQGAPMAEMIGRAGLDLRIWARRREVRAECARQGVSVANDPRALAAECDVVCLCVTTEADVRDLADTTGLLAACDRVRPC